METSKANSGKKRGWIKDVSLIVLGTLLGTAANLIGDQFKGPNVQLEEMQSELVTQTSELQTQTGALRKGFEQLITAVNAESDANPQVTKMLEELSARVDSVSDVSGNISETAEGVTQWASYYKGVSKLEEKGVDEVFVSTDDMNAQRIDSKNEVAVLYDRDKQGSMIQVNLSGKREYLNKGERLEFITEAGQRAVFVYMGKLGNKYAFHYFPAA